MADIAIPARETTRKGLAALARSRFVGVGAAGLVFAGAVAGLATLARPLLGESHARFSLASALKAAPSGWREALTAARGPLAVIPDVMRLSERPLSGGLVVLAPPPMEALAGVALPPAPLAGFFAPGPSGPLPIIAADGRTPAQAYARPFHANGRPKVSLVIRGLGQNAALTRQAIEALRPEVTLSFVVYAEGLQGWIDMARARGHEVLLEAPMEPLDYPDNDPGPYALMTDAPAPETVKKLEWILSRASGYFGLTNALGSRFLTAEPAYGALASALRGRGLAFVDDGQAVGRGGGVRRATAELSIDAQRSGAAIDQQLLALEAGALQRGQSMGMGFAYPVTLQKAAAWAAEVEQRGYQLAPVSALTVRK